MDFSPEGKYIYYVQKTLSSGKCLKHIPTASMGPEQITSSLLAGDVRRTVHGQMLFTDPVGKRVRTVSNPDGTFSIATIMTTTRDVFTNLALQPLVLLNAPPVALRQLGCKHYQLADHLGNVRVVLSDIKLSTLFYTLTHTIPDDFRADVLARSDYYAFGSLMPKRNYSSDAYLFGFNGKPKDDEIHGSTGTSYDFGARMYDPRVGRWLALDPIAIKYPELSPYQFAGDNPILNIDPDGKRIWPVNQRAKDALISTLTSFAPADKVGDIFGVHISQRTGAFYSNDNGSPISEKAFGKRLRQAKVKLGKEQQANAYSTYLAIASSDEIQVEVVETATPSATRTMGTPGSIVDGESDRINANRGLNDMKADIKANGSATPAIINEAVRPDGGAGTGKYKPDAVGVGYSVYDVPKDGDNHGASKTILIDGSGKTDQQNAATLQKALSSEK